MNVKKQLCARIISEANDLKRTIPALARELHYAPAQLETILKGEGSLTEIYEVIDRMGEQYPIDKADLMLLQDDCTHGVKIMRHADSEKSARIFDRKGSPYYEYRDTAMSRLAPFKPEWIKELRVVDNADPNNPAVVYNNGHFMHQTTFFIGPVNFYWEVDGKRFCEEMTTGDSNYITPYWKHSFTNRAPNQTALILAITFGGMVRSAQKEFYALGEKSKNFQLDYRNQNRAITQLIRQHMANENLSEFNLTQKLAKFDSVKAKELLDETKPKSQETLCILAEIFNIQITDLLLSNYRPEDEVVITNKSTSTGYYYPDEHNPLYHLTTLARTPKMPQMKSFMIEVLNKQCAKENALSAPTHTWAYHYGQSPCTLVWWEGDNKFEETLNPGDSFYIQPFVKHALCQIENTTQLYMVRVPGSIHLATQKELAHFSDINRVMAENTCWF